MKKRVEADLISIAHRILKLKNKSEVDVLHIEIKKLYDAITVLKFYNDNFDQVKNTVSEADLMTKLTTFLDNNEYQLDSITNQTFDAQALLPVIESAIGTDNLPLDSVLKEPKGDNSDFEPLFELAAESVFEPIKSSPVEISFEDLIGKNYDGAQFVKPAQLELEKKQLLDKTNYGLSISLNDRIGFEQHLFGGSSEDFNRVLSQLNTFDTIGEALTFIEQIVKPDYDNWIGKDDFEKRFIALIENKFK